MYKMKIQHFNRLNDIPGIERFSGILPVFATQEYADYLKEVRNYSTIWFYCIISPNIQLIIPFAVRNRYILKDGKFLTATISSDENTDTETEREFLNSIIAFIGQNKLCDWIGQPPNWSLFRVVPSNSIYCEFGTYRIDLVNNDEKVLFNKINYHHKRLINKSQNNNIIVKRGSELLDDCVNIFTEAAVRGNHTLPTKNEIKEFFDYLPDNVNIYVSYNDTIPLSSIVHFSNKFCLYLTYIGTISAQSVGGNHFLHWQAIKDAKNNGIQYIDFIGARINPIPGSKQEGIQKFKKYFGGELVKGYLWKMPIRKSKYYFYNFLVRCKYFIEFKKYEGDIIDQEIRRKNEKKVHSIISMIL